MSAVVDAVAAANPPKAIEAVVGNAASNAAAKAPSKMPYIIGAIIVVILLVVVIVVPIVVTQKKAKEEAEAKAKADAAAKAKAEADAKAKAPPPPAPAPAPAASQAPAPAPAPAAFQFDEACATSGLKQSFGDAPFIPKYIAWIKSLKVQTTAPGSSCPPGTAYDPKAQAPGMTCLVCPPTDMVGKPGPSPPEDLKKEINDWYAKKNAEAQAKKLEAVKQAEAVKAPPPPTVTFFSDCNFAGQSKQFGKGKYRWIVDAGFPNDALSSFIMSPGSKLILYEDIDFKGRSSNFGAGPDGMKIPCLINFKIPGGTWNDRVSSFEVA